MWDFAKQFNGSFIEDFRKFVSDRYPFSILSVSNLGEFLITTGETVNGRPVVVNTRLTEKREKDGSIVILVSELS